MKVKIDEFDKLENYILDAFSSIRFWRKDMK